MTTPIAYLYSHSELYYEHLDSVYEHVVIAAEISMLQIIY
jgi:hypothetical protein